MSDQFSQQEMGEVVLEDVFHSHGNKGIYHVLLVRDFALLYKKVKSSHNKQQGLNSHEAKAINLKDYSEYETLSFDHVTGCQCMRDPTKPQLYDSAEESVTESNRAYFCVYAYPIRKKKNFGKTLKRQRVSLTLMVNRCELFSENLAIAEQWRDAIRRMLKGPGNIPNGMPSPSSRKYLIFVSPKSGSGRALTIFKQRVLPMLAEASISYDLIITDRQNAARDYVNTAEDLNKWHGIVVVAGDGLVYEVVNGLMERSDGLQAIKTPIGVVPCGSGNGLAKSISHALREPLATNPFLLSTFNAIKTKVVPMDLIRLQTSNSTIFSFLSVGWGIIADIDIESERLRSLGKTRFTLWAFHRIANLKTYKGRLSYLPIPNYERTAAKTTKTSKMNEPINKKELFQRSQSSGDAQTSSRLKPEFSKSLPENLEEHVNEDSEDSRSEGNDLEPVEQLDRIHNLVDVATDEVAARNEVTDHSFDKTSLLEPLDQPVPAHWIEQEGEFVLVYVVYQSHIGSDLYCAPQATLDDGKMWMMIIRKGVTRTQLANFMMTLETGSHVDLPFLEIIPIQAFRLEPLSEGGHLTVDGELVDYGPIQAEVLPSLARIMVHH